MSITLYREGLPRVDLLADYLEGGEGMLVGFVEYGQVGSTVKGIVMLHDGSLTMADLGHFRVQMHYEPESDSWVDENKDEDEMSPVLGVE